ncbi:hypothetical protein, partial [Deinococcus sp.]|uniref:hypothetical protein n=1 Tax=Deinococcus sp. TaxID=47478 RepID=UPI00286E403F
SQVWAQMVRTLVAELLEFSSIWYETHVPLGLHLSHRQTFDLTADCLWSGSATERATVQATAPPFVQSLHFLRLPHPADRRPEVPPFPTTQE